MKDDFGFHKDVKSGDYNPLQSAHPAPAVCVEVWAAVRERELAWETESVSVIQDTLGISARAVLMATTERKAPMTAQEPAQVPLIQTNSYMHETLFGVIVR